MATAEQARSQLRQAAQVTLVHDREGDLYPLWARVPRAGVHVLSRVMVDRRLAGGGLSFKRRRGLRSGCGRAPLGLRCASAASRLPARAMSRPATQVFSAAEVDTLEALRPTLEGRVERQKNPHPPRSLARANWVIARLGSWHGYGEPPAPITMHRGLERFFAIRQGRMLATEAI
ncbi:MAG: hypothetical protein ACJ8AI_07540 [Rhodopila sp.]